MPTGTISSELVFLPGVTEQHVSETFDIIDFDNNGYVGASELRHLLTMLGEKPTDEEIDEMIRMLDSDGDGQVAFEDFKGLFFEKNAVLAEMLAEAPDEAELSEEAELKRKIEGMDAGRRSILAKTLGGFSHATVSVQAQKTRAKQLPGSKGRTLRASLAAAEDAELAVPEAESNELDLDDPTKQFGTLKPSQMKKIYKKFKEIDVDASGMIDYQEFCLVMDQEDTPLMKRMFAMFDKDGNGTIEVKEFMVGLSAFTTSNRQDKTKFAFMMFDEDGSGFLERDEIEKIIKANFLSATSSEKDVQRRVDKVLKAAGENEQTGRLSFDQFMAVSQKTPGLMFPAFALMGQVGESTGMGRR